MSNAVSLERIENSLVIRFIRPEIRNPLSVEVLEYITSIVEELDPSVGRIIFTGTSDVFAAGADLREIDKVTVDEAKAFAERGQRLMNVVETLPDTVAAINGFCFGGALDLALSCKRRIAVVTAEFCHPGVALGIITGWGGTQLPAAYFTERLDAAILSAALRQPPLPADSRKDCQDWLARPLL